MYWTLSLPAHFFGSFSTLFAFPSTATFYILQITEVGRKNKQAKCFLPTCLCTKDTVFGEHLAMSFKGVIQSEHVVDICFFASLGCACCLPKKMCLTCFSPTLYFFVSNWWSALIRPFMGFMPRFFIKLRGAVRALDLKTVRKVTSLSNSFCVAYFNEKM